MKRRSADKKEEALHYRSKRLATSLGVLLFVVLTFLVLAMAWFASNQNVGAGGMQIGVQTPADNTFKLYLQNGSGQNTWTEEQSIDFASAGNVSVPGEVRRYKVVPSNTDSDATKVKLTITDVTARVNNGSATLTTDDNMTPEAYNDLLKLIYIKSVASYEADYLPTGITTTIITNKLIDAVSTASIFTLAGNTVGTNSLVIQLDYTGTTPANGFIFDIYVDKDICNCFYGWGFEGRVEIE